MKYNELSHRQVAEEVAYRFEDRRYSVSDEYGEHAYTSYQCVLLVFPIIKYTKCGMWIWTGYSHYPMLPHAYDPTKDYVAGCKRFVNSEANKRYALPTIDEAYVSYMARKNREISIYNARIKAAEAHKLCAKTFCMYKVVGHALPSLKKELLLKTGGPGAQNIPS